jgi:hypothetical protein
MQCASCQFENMPGSDLCGRCGTSLRLATAVIDVHPPRAGRWTKRVRRVAPRLSVPVRARAGVALSTLAARTRSTLGIRLSDTTPALPLLLRVPVPGWPQLYAGNRVLGRWFLYGWLLLLAVWVLFFYGTTFGSMVLGLAFAVHSASIADATNRILEPGSIRRRIAYSFCTSCMLFGFLYLPVGRLLFAVADPMVLQMDLHPFREGDVLLVNHAAFARSEPSPGQIVLFTPPEYRVGGGNHAMTIYTGPRIDRILAGPGDRVSWSKRRLTVNGRLTTLEPLNLSAMPLKFELTVPAGSYLIVPTTTPRVARSTDLVDMALIRREEISGTVYLQTQPMSRLKVLR